VVEISTRRLGAIIAGSLGVANAIGENAQLHPSFADGGFASKPTERIGHVPSALIHISRG